MARMMAYPGRQVLLRETDWVRREDSNRSYMMRLENRYLLRNYLLEAGLYSGRGKDPEAFGGWEDPSCQLRGHFLGHFLSAAAVRWQEKEDVEIRAKVQALLEELARCQEENRDGWAGPIPEKYLIWIGKGKSVWAPQYTMHKLLMGLCDVFRLMDLPLALQIADRQADWFLAWSGQYDREAFDEILDVETGGMLEVWADLYDFTGDDKYRTLLKRYYRSRLFDPLLEGRDVLTNMHANTTIPEVLGCARAYEVTGEEKWLKIAEAYWRCAVTERGAFATGGQTQGEIWTPKQKLKARLGDKNQEHCTVYNMIRLAEFLFRQTGDPGYMQYIEYNLYNGIFAQAYWEGDDWHGARRTGLLTYFLPLKAGSRKDWAGERDAFFCCHGTMVQANAALNRCLFYTDEDSVYVTMYADADLLLGDGTLLALREDRMNGNLQHSSVNDASQRPDDAAALYENRPSFRRYDLTVHGDVLRSAVCLRIPEWIAAPAEISVNGKPLMKCADPSHFARLPGPFREGDRISVRLPVSLRFIPLPDDPSMGAFRYGPDVLAGLTEQERILTLQDGEAPEEELSADTERQWGEWRTFFRTENQDPGISLIPLRKVGYEAYQVYFKIRREGAGI